MEGHLREAADLLSEIIVAGSARAEEIRLSEGIMFGVHGKSQMSRPLMRMEPIS